MHHDRSATELLMNIYRSTSSLSVLRKIRISLILRGLTKYTIPFLLIRPRQVFRVTQLKHVSNPTWAGFWAQGGGVFRVGFCRGLLLIIITDPT
jgi:hypothetical protein